MNIGLIFLAFILFLIADFLLRYFLRKRKENKIKSEREKILNESLQTDFTFESKTLKRVEVDKPKARILCVDDEEVILSSFRKILVLDGYCVDTVETGQEALGLIQTHHYDFVFTDLKMPQMSGEEVAKSVKNLRPDIDVIIITGYATVQSAVEVMQYGAMDYIQKPFTEEELLGYVKNFILKREDNTRKKLRPRVNITHASEKTVAKADEFVIPGGVFISEGHTWANIHQEGKVGVGIDDFAKKVIGKVDGIIMPNLGMQVKAGKPLFKIRQDKKTITFNAPVSGQVVSLNNSLLDEIENLEFSSYDPQWICEINAENLDTEIKNLKIGKSAISYFQSEIDSFHKSMETVKKYNKISDNDTESNFEDFGKLPVIDDFHWHNIVTEFFSK